MKVITLIQPWATLIALGEKKIETRSWKTSYRGPLLIHAGKKVDNCILLEPFASVLNKYKVDRWNIPTGVIIAKCNLIDCVKIGDWMLDNFYKAYLSFLENGQEIKGNELEFGDYSPGRYAWILDNIEILKEPIPAKGQLSLWNYNMEE